MTASLSSLYKRQARRIRIKARLCSQAREHGPAAAGHRQCAACLKARATTRTK